MNNVRIKHRQHSLLHQTFFFLSVHYLIIEIQTGNVGGSWGETHDMRHAFFFFSKKLTNV